jgi:hypothetical protein
MGRSEADGFLKLAKFADREWGAAFIYTPNDDYYRPHGMTYEVLGDLSALGLLDVNSMGWSMGIPLADRSAVETKVAIMGTVFAIPTPPTGDIQVSTGMVSLTSYGKQLLSLIYPYPEPAPGIGEQILAGMRRYNGNVKIVGATSITVPPVEN